MKTALVDQRPGFGGAVTFKIKSLTGVLCFIAPVLIAFIGLSQFHHWFAYYYLLFLAIAMAPGIAGWRLNTSHLNLYISCYWTGFLIMIATALLSGDLYYPSKTLAKMLPIAAFISVLALHKDREYHLIALLFGFILGAFSSISYVVATIDLGMYLANPVRSILDPDVIRFNQNNLGFTIFSGIFATVLAYCFRRLSWPVALAILAILFCFVLASWSTRSIIASGICILAFLIMSGWRVWSSAGLLVMAALWLQPAALTSAVGIPVSRVLGFFDIPYRSDAFSADWGVSRAEGRYELWKTTLEQFYQNPVTGIGIENTRNILGTYSHFDFIEILAGAGLFGALTFYLGYLLVLKGVISSPLDNRKRIVLVMLWLTLIFLSVANRIYDLPQVQIFFTAMLIAAWSMNGNIGRELSRSQSH